MPRILAETFTVAPESIDITPVCASFPVVTDAAEIQSAIDAGLGRSR